MEFSSDTQTRNVSALLEEMFQNVLYDEEPLFISDEATLWGVSMSDVEDVLGRCRSYYGVHLSLEHLPGWYRVEVAMIRGMSSHGASVFG